MYDRLIANWVYGGLLAAMLLTGLAPVLTRGWPAALAATFLATPAYRFHQFEEHDDGRFGHFVNRRLGGWNDVLSPLAIVVINVPGVWGINALSLWLAATVDLGFGLIAAYLMLINAIGHIVGMLVFRGYNPGLVTSVLLFLPLAVYLITAIDAAGGGTVTMHLTGLLLSLVIHALIVLHVVVERQRLRVEMR